MITNSANCIIPLILQSSIHEEIVSATSLERDRVFRVVVQLSHPVSNKH